MQVDGCPLNKGKAAARTTRGLCIYLMFMLETIIFEFPKKVNVIHTEAVMGGAAGEKSPERELFSVEPGLTSQTAAERREIP